MTPIATPTPGEVNAGGGPVLVWHREGGIAGSCDDLTVSADGSYTAERCTGEAMTSTLTADEQALLNDWIARLAPFEINQTDPATADAMTIKLTFAGEGTQEPSEADRQAIQAFAADAYASAMEVSPSVTPTPEVVSPVRGEDRAYDAARDALVQQTGVAFSDIQRIEVSKQEWTDSCLGLGGPAETCAAVITPGYRVVMEANSLRYVVRTNDDGSVVRFEHEVAAWGDAVSLILDGHVTQIFQTHALTVTLYMDDGSKVVTTEPAIDDVFDVVSRCGDPCSDIILATE